MHIEQTYSTHMCIQVAPNMRHRYMFVATHIYMLVATHTKFFVAMHMHIEQICVHESQRTRAYVLQQKCTCVAANMCICVATKMCVHRATSRTHTFSLNYGLCTHSKSFMSAQHIWLCKMSECVFTQKTECLCVAAYGVATISRLLKIIGLFCKNPLQKRRYSAKETYTFKEPTTFSHPIVAHTHTQSELWALLRCVRAVVLVCDTCIHILKNSHKYMCRTSYVSHTIWGFGVCDKCVFCDWMHSHKKLMCHIKTLTKDICVTHKFVFCEWMRMHILKKSQMHARPRFLCLSLSDAHVRTHTHTHAHTHTHTRTHPLSLMHTLNLSHCHHTVHEHRIISLSLSFTLSLSLSLSLCPSHENHIDLISLPPPLLPPVPVSLCVSLTLTPNHAHRIVHVHEKRLT